MPLSWFTLALCVACTGPGRTPEPAISALPAPSDEASMTDPLQLYRDFAQRSGGATELAKACPEHDLGPFRCFTGATPGRTFVSTAGALGRDGSGPWADFLRAGAAPEIADRIEKMFSDRQLMLLQPTASPPARVAAAEWAMVQAPTLTELPKGSGIAFQAWYGSPPGFGPTRLSITVDGSGGTKLTEVTAGQLVSPADAAGAWLAALDGSSSQGQRQAAEWLGENREPRAVPGLIRLLETSTWGEARLAAAKALGQLRAAEGAPAIERAAARETDAWTVSVYLESLAAIGGEPGRSALARIRDDHPSADVRARAGYELGRLK